jgi:hypothetical protein
MYRTVLSLSAILIVADSPRAEAPPVAEVSWPHLRDHCRELLRELASAGAPLPEATARSLRRLLDAEPTDPDAAVTAVRQLLEPHCLVGVNINPESRVKAAHSAASTVLDRDKSVVVLVRIDNEGGVTSALAVSGPGLIAAKSDSGWLDVTPISRNRLSGRRLEYVALRLCAREEGRREATFRFDVGQGTQDLGFRAEVPILFSVRNP